MARYQPALALAISLLATSAMADSYADLFPDFAADTDPEVKEYVALQDKLNYQRGTVTIGNGLATLNLGQDYYYLDPKDADYVLTELWSNPPGVSSLGIVMPVTQQPMDPDGWAMVLEFDQIGYVSDADAESYDYDELLRQMQADAQASSVERVKDGYPTIELVGWAETPSYDSASHILYWAKELKFGDMEENSLNYNLRALGRKGVLVMNVVGQIDELPAIRAATPDILAMTSFTVGNRYSDFDASTDEVSAYGIGGLIAGGILAKKTGLLAVALLMLKKFWFILLVPLFWLKNLVTGNRQQRDDVEG